MGGTAMTETTRRVALAGLLFGGFALLAPTAAAQDCPRGALDVRFCDRDGDLVADTPTDPSQWIAPQTLVFAYTPVEDPAVYRRVRAEFIDHRDSPIQRMDDLRGRTIAFTSQTSNSGFKAPSALLEKTYGLVAERDFRPAFSGRHDNSIIGVANRDYEAAAIANSVMNRMNERGVVDRNAIRSICKSQSFPTTGCGYVLGLS
jgi:hypothetical protein